MLSERHIAAAEEHVAQLDNDGRKRAQADARRLLSIGNQLGVFPEDWPDELGDLDDGTQCLLAFMHAAIVKAIPAGEFVPPATRDMTFSERMASRRDARRRR